MQEGSTTTTNTVGNVRGENKEDPGSLAEIPCGEDSNSMTMTFEHANGKKIGKDGQETQSQSGNVEVRRMGPAPKHLSASPPPRTEPPVKNNRAPLFKPDELRHTLAPTMEKIYQQCPESIPFRHPIDPKALGIPDYFDIIKNPMDLSTIKKKLDTEQYIDPWDYVNDVWQVFDNAWLYNERRNRKSSRVYKYCTKLAAVFEQEIDPVMQSLGYCCGRKYTFNPQVLCCYGKQLCTIIPRHNKYFSYKNRYTYCEKCFNAIQGITISLGDDPSQQALKIKKSQFQKKKNNALDLEPMVECLVCGRKLHQICVLHMEQIWPNGFTCDGCLKKKGQTKKENKFTAKKLPTTKLSNYLETRVNKFLKEKKVEAGEVFIRVLSSIDKAIEVKGGMKKRFVDTGQLSAEFSYRAKALFAYEEIDGIDICIFGMHVQEYGSDAPCPNTRQVYLAYLDSVHFFKPKQYRTAVYHEILLGYLDYVKQLGYTKAHIWAWPSSEGDNYIFHCHPSNKKNPKHKHLQDWYKKMLDKGIIERIVLEYKDIYKQACEDNMKSPAELPYFAGDFWPIILEESIKELDQKDNEKHKHKEATSRSQCNDLAKQIYTTMEKHKDVFFVIHLHSAQSVVSLPPIQDPDPITVCDLMDGRYAFLTLARERNLEFSSLRRAKYSTMCMLYELHNRGQELFVYICNSCKTHVETRYHCQKCDDYDLCTTCSKTEEHPHKMIKLGFDIDDSSANAENKNLNPHETRQQSIQRCIKPLVHASQCYDANCHLPSCQKMKCVLSHTKSCNKKNNGGCVICRKLITLCCYHARKCKEQRCVVPYCYNIKQKEIQQRFQQQVLMKRRIQQMTLRSIRGVGPLPAPPAMQQAVSQLMQYPLQQPLHPGVKPAQAPPPNVLQTLKMVNRGHDEDEHLSDSSHSVSPVAAQRPKKKRKLSVNKDANEVVLMQKIVEHIGNIEHKRTRLDHLMEDQQQPVGKRDIFFRYLSAHSAEVPEEHWLSYSTEMMQLTAKYCNLPNNMAQPRPASSIPSVDHQTPQDQYAYQTPVPTPPHEYAPPLVFSQPPLYTNLVPCQQNSSYQAPPQTGVGPFPSTSNAPMQSWQSTPELHREQAE